LIFKKLSAKYSVFGNSPWRDYFKKTKHFARIKNYKENNRGTKT